MRSKNRLLLCGLLGALVLTSGCYRVSVTHGRGREVTGRRADYSRWQHHLIAGLVRAGAHVNLDQICPEGVAAVRTDVSFLNNLVAWLTGGIYTPSRLKVWCETAPRPVQAVPAMAPQPAPQATLGPPTAEILITQDAVERWAAARPEQVQELIDVVQSTAPDPVHPPSGLAASGPAQTRPTNRF